MAITEPLRIDLRTDTARVVCLALSGDLDLATATDFADRFGEACAAKPSQILLDFTDLTFCDSSGIRACILASQHCADIGAKLTILGASDRVRQVFTIVGLDENFRWTDD